MHTFRTAVTSVALTTLTLGLVVVAAPAASAEPTTTELCALATSDVIGKLQSSGALEGLEVQGVPVTSLPASAISTAARNKLNCGSVPKISASEAKAKICPQLTVAGLRAFASRLGASAESQGKITEGRVAKARTALECDKVVPPGPITTSTPKPTPTPTSSAKPTPTATSTTTSTATATSSATATSATTTQARGGTTTTTKPGTRGDSFLVDLDCKDFPTQAAAQKAFDNDRSDPHNLDRDNDGFACELGGGTGTGTSGNGAADSGDYTSTGGYGQVGDGDVPVGSIATGGL
jgi:hypothetical protein